MINAESIDISILPSLFLSDRKQLPKVACIYFAIDAMGQIQYIGKSVNLRQRWCGSHHRIEQLKSMENIRIAWLEVSDPLLLPKIENALISQFSPPLNKTISCFGSDNIHIKLPEKLREPLEKLAIRHNKTWGSKANPTDLIRAIALEEISLLQLNPAQVAAMSAAIWSLRDGLQPEAAKELINVLLAIDKIPAVEQEYFLKMKDSIEAEQISIHSQLDKCLVSKQPFHIQYLKRGQGTKKYLVKGAFIKLFPSERHRYLVGVLNSGLGIEDNRTFRLDQIKEVSPAYSSTWIDVPWVEAKIQLNEDLASHYEPRQDDLSWNPSTGILVKKAYTLWWLKREIIKYGKGAKILAPQEAIDLLVAEVRGMLANYQC